MLHIMKISRITYDRFLVFNKADWLWLFHRVCVSGVNSWLSWWCCCVSGYSIIDLLSGCFVMDEMNLGSYCSNIMDEVVL